MGRKKLTDRPRKWNLHIPSSLDSAIEEYIRDDIFDRRQHGMRSALVKQLLTELIADLRAGNAMIDPATFRIIRRKKDASENPRD